MPRISEKNDSFLPQTKQAENESYTLARYLIITGVCIVILLAIRVAGVCTIVFSPNKIVQIVGGCASVLLGLLPIGGMWLAAK